MSHQFPEVWLDTTTVLYRVHREHREPEHFGTSGDMRFDPPLSHRTRFGTCYVAEIELACVLEVFGSIGVISQTELDIRRTTTLQVAHRTRLADLTARSILGQFRLDGSLHTGMDRTATQQFAAERHEEGFDGILYKIRHDPALRLAGIALFGEPGTQRQMFTAAKTRMIDSEALTAMQDEFSIEVRSPLALPVWDERLR